MPRKPHSSQIRALNQNSPPSPNASDMTAGELWALRDALEVEAASLLGHMLFEFSRLDVNLGLCLVWVDGGVRLEALTPQVADLSFNDKLLQLSKHVNAKLPVGSKRRSAYEGWIERMHAVRLQRNQLVHGRWGIEPYKNKVVSVTGLPTGTQLATEYSMADLAAINDELRSLQRELARLRDHWPL